MNIKLFFEAFLKFLFGMLLVGLIIFIPANTLKYWNGWLLLALLFIPMCIMGIVMMVKNPDLLKSRLVSKEVNGEQKLIIILSGMMFLSGFVIAGFNYRFSWIHLPDIVIVLSSIIFILSYILYAEVLRENAFLSRTIQVQKGQKLIDTGLYKIVRHPMYFSTIFLFLSMPLILDSFLSFIIFLIYPLLIINRINNEEKFLEDELIGYKEYKNKVKYKLIPFIW